MSPTRIDVITVTSDDGRVVVSGYRWTDTGRALVGSSSFPVVGGDMMGAFQRASADFQQAFQPSLGAWEAGVELMQQEAD